MLLVCASCSRVLEYVGERPSFCGFCGHALAAAGPVPEENALRTGGRFVRADSRAEASVTVEQEAATVPPKSTSDAETVPPLEALPPTGHVENMRDEGEETID